MIEFFNDVFSIGFPLYTLNPPQKGQHGLRMTSTLDSCEQKSQFKGIGIGHVSGGGRESSQGLVENLVLQFFLVWILRFAVGA